MKTARKHGTIAFITTPVFREKRREIARNFVYRRLYGLCRHFNVRTTGRTYTELIAPLLDKPFEQLSVLQRKMIEDDMKVSIRNPNQYEEWQSTIRSGLKATMSSFQGMIHIAYELVEGRLDALIHLTDVADKSAKPDSAVLSREANAHNVPAANDVDTATAFIESWESKLARPSTVHRLFLKREGLKTKLPLKDIQKKHRVLAMVAHDNMKLELCCFAVKNATHIFNTYNFILATGTTGLWLIKFMEAAGRSSADVARIKRCNSGPEGGDVQIAYAVVKELCQEIVFLQDPSVSHPHDSDIRLLEQATLAPEVKVKLATNLESAKLLIGV